MKVLVNESQINVEFIINQKNSMRVIQKVIVIQMVDIMDITTMGMAICMILTVQIIPHIIIVITITIKNKEGTV